MISPGYKYLSLIIFMHELMQISVKFCLKIGLSFNTILLASSSRLSRKLAERILMTSYSFATLDP